MNVHIDELTESIRDALKGAVDFHIHSHVAPGYRWNLVELAEQAISAGMSGLVIKNLRGTSHESCHLANKQLGRIFLHPTLTLGKTTGGLNPFIVDHFSRAHSANRIVEMPVSDSAHGVRLRGLPESQGVPVFENGKPVPGLAEILKIMAERDMILKTGHIGPAESMELIRLASEAGVRKIVVTHATGSPVMAEPKDQKQMADMGAFIEHCLIKFTPISLLLNRKRYPDWKGRRFADLDYLKASVEIVGADRCIAATDSGQVYNPSPLESFVYFLYLLEELGCTAEEIRTMARDNPRRLLNISES